jgi:hypothetical protein
LSYAEIKALAAGNPKIKEKMELDVQIAKLRAAKANHQNSQYALQDKLRNELSIQASMLENKIPRLREDIELRDANSPEKNAKNEKEKFFMTLNGASFEKRDEAGEELLALTNAYVGAEPIKTGSYRGFDMMLEYDSFFDMHYLTLKGNSSYKTTLGDSAAGNIARLNNILNGFEDKISKLEEELKNCENQTRLAMEQIKKPFAQENDLSEKSERLAKLNLELNIDSPNSEDDEKEIALSEDEEYEYRNELLEAGIDESELFPREKGEPDKVIAGVDEELSEQEKNDEPCTETESGSIVDIDGTTLVNDDLPGILREESTEERNSIIAEAMRRLAAKENKSISQAVFMGR